MGCDIHVKIQVKDDFYGWRSVGVPDDGRWYSFFEMLCGVRASNGFSGVMPSRGLPEPLGYGCNHTKERKDCFGDHSQTWFTLAEMKAAVPRAMAFVDSTIPPDWQNTASDRYKAWIELGDVLAKNHDISSDDDVRYVVGFDS